MPDHPWRFAVPTSGLDSLKRGSVSRRSIVQGLALLPAAATLYGAAATSSPTAQAATGVTVKHGSVPTTARPAASVVTWVGDVRPVNAVNGDLWVIA